MNVDRLADKTDLIRFQQDGDITTVNDDLLKLEEYFTYISISISSTESYFNIRIDNAWTTVHRFSTICKSVTTDKIKWEFFLAAIVFVLLYGCKTSTLMNDTASLTRFFYILSRMLCVVLDKYQKQHPSKAPLYSHLRPIQQSIQVKRTTYTRGNAGEEKLNSEATFCYGLRYTDTLVLDDHQTLV